LIQKNKNKLYHSNSVSILYVFLKKQEFVCEYEEKMNQKNKRIYLVDFLLLSASRFLIVFLKKMSDNNSNQQWQTTRPAKQQQQQHAFQRQVYAFFVDHQRQHYQSLSSTSFESDSEMDEIVNLENTMTIDELIEQPMFPEERINNPLLFNNNNNDGTGIAVDQEIDLSSSSSSSSLAPTLMGVVSDSHETGNNDEQAAAEWYAYDCIPHVAARTFDFRMLKILVALFGHDILFKQNNYGLTPWEIFIACRSVRELSNEHTDFLVEIGVLENPYDHSDAEKGLIETPYDKLNAQLDSVIEQHKQNDALFLYRMYVYLIFHSRYHGYYFSQKDNFDMMQLKHLYLANEIGSTITALILENALLFLPRDRWTEPNARHIPGLLTNILQTIYVAFEKLSLTETHELSAMDQLVIRFLHHFSGEEWLANNKSPFIMSPMRCFVRTVFYSPEVVRLDQQTQHHLYYHNQHYVLDRQVLMEAATVLTLECWKKHSNPWLTRMNPGRPLMMLDFFHILVTRLVQEPEEVVIDFVNYEYEGDKFFNRFALCFLDFPNAHQVLLPLFRRFPIMFSIAHSQVREEKRFRSSFNKWITGPVWPLYQESNMLHTVATTLLNNNNNMMNANDQQTSENNNYLWSLMMDKAWNNPVIVLNDIVGRQANFLLMNQAYEDQSQEQPPTL